MSWHYLQELEEASWEGSSLDGAPCALLKMLPTLGEFSSRDSAIGCSQDSRSGTTFGPSTGDRGEGQLGLFPEAGHVPRSPRVVHVKALPESVRAFGSRCSELLRRFGLRLSSRKTVRDSGPVGSPPLSKGYPAWGMTFAGAYWELGTRAKLIDETGCGSLLPTPTANHYGTTNNGRRGDGSIYKTAGKPSLQTMARHNVWTDGHSEPGGDLNPTWVESHLMDWPPGWTDLERSETGNIRSQLPQLGEYLVDHD